MASPVAVEIRGLSEAPLRGVELRVEAGERVAIVGESGSGKTTLLDCMLGLRRPRRGAVRLLGRRIGWRVASLDGLGVAFQEGGLLDTKTVRGNLHDGGGSGVPDARLRELLDGVGLDEVGLDEPADELSGGQKKRVSLLRALLRGRRLLVLDEPTSGLDPVTGDRVATFLSEHLTGDEHTVVVVTHDYRLALRLCSRVFLLSEGCLVPVEFPARASLEDKTRRLEALLAKSEGAAPRLLSWRQRLVGLVPGPLATWCGPLVRFTALGIAMAVVAMGLLGAMIVSQTASVSAVDVSPYVPRAVAVGVFREIAPLVVGLLLAARVASGVSAQVGAMSYTAQIDSMLVLRRWPSRSLLGPFALGAAVAFPVCIVAGALAALAAGYGVASSSLSPLSIGPARFRYLAGQVLRTEPALLWSCLVKGVVMGIVVATAAYAVPRFWRVTTATRLERAVTAASIAAALLVVLVDVVVSYLYFGGLQP